MGDELIYAAGFAGAGLVIKGIYSFIREAIDTYRMKQDINKILVHLNSTEDYTIDRVVYVSQLVDGLKEKHKRPACLTLSVKGSDGDLHRINLISE